MKTSRWLALIAAVLITLMLIAVLGSPPAGAASSEACDMQLTVELTPDVPDPRDAGFLSSLLSNHPSYQLTLRRQSNSSVIVLDLTGPGPDYRCQDVVEAMRKDGRVLAIHTYVEPSTFTDSDEVQGVAVVATPLLAEGRSHTHLSLTGIGSLYWAARHPAQAWRVLLPIQPGDEFDASANVRASP